MSDQDESIEVVLDKPQEKLELCLKGVGKFAKDKQIKKELQTLLGEQFVEYERITKPKMKPYCFLRFTTEEDKQKMSDLIKNLPSKNKKLRIGEVSHSYKYEQKTQRQDKPDRPHHQAQQHPFKPPVRKEFTQAEVIKQTAQLYDLPYDQQVQFKQNSLIQMLQKFRKIYLQKLSADETSPPWIKDSEKDINILTQLDAPIVCDEEQLLNYRNKSEFTVGYNQKDEPTIGFNVGCFQDNNASVEKGTGCKVTPQISLELAEVLEQYVISSSLKPFNRTTGEGSKNNTYDCVGFWRLFCVRRSTRTKQLYLIVTIQKTAITQEQYDVIVVDLIKIFLEAQQEYKLQGITIIHSLKKGSDQPESEADVYHIYGEPFYTEIIMGKEFKISYNGFLQNHIEQCDKLYSKIVELTKVCKPTMFSGQPVFLDVCAGSGTIGVCVADSVKEVIGIEMNEQSCKDANENYTLNHLTNCRMVCSKVENVMKEISNDLKNKPTGSHFIACLDPPRSGIMAVVTDALRTCKGCDNIIYVSCCPPMIIDNLLQLCLPSNKRRKAPGFKIKSVTMVDMFPQTNHYEAIFHLERDYLFIG